MTKIIIFLLACSTCELEKIEMFKPINLSCGDYGNQIIETTTTYYNETDDISQGNYTKDGKLFVGFRCE
jgi:hypothetical protein